MRMGRPTCVGPADHGPAGEGEKKKKVRTVRATGPRRRPSFLTYERGLQSTGRHRFLRAQSGRAGHPQAPCVRSFTSSRRAVTPCVVFFSRHAVHAMHPTTESWGEDPRSHRTQTICEDTRPTRQRLRVNCFSRPNEAVGRRAWRGVASRDGTLNGPNRSTPGRVRPWGRMATTASQYPSGEVTLSAGSHVQWAQQGRRTASRGTGQHLQPDLSPLSLKIR
ncbi:hypothetical protein VTO42DRAFT_2404 [Malbranchea cinnamomea]